MQSRKSKKIRNMILIGSFSAVLLIVSTYAWFVGMRTVSVSTFDVEIKAAESLMLSLNGTNWSGSVSINKATVNSAGWVGNKNSWGGEGLIPMSTVGKIDKDSSRLVLFEKASLTASPGGYRLMASRVDNYTDDEKDGYVAFDLFIKNISGTQYDPNWDEIDEEAIYLTVDSEVKVSEAGTSGEDTSDGTIAGPGVANTGIENSVRVAFAQIGRVIGTETDSAIITGIKCIPDSGSTVTGICRDAQIWEPNDTAHVSNAIKWYNKSCLSREGADITDPESYDGACNPVVDGKANKTYAIQKEITSANKVDIYDGEDYNGYTGSSEFLKEQPYFTDSDKYLRGTDRKPFISLAPNSITKVRVYVYIEGQDIDNYDYASIGKKISINFGFTKQRFTEDDINYDGPDVNQGYGPAAADKTPPVITLLGTVEKDGEGNPLLDEDGNVVMTNVNPRTVALGSEFIDPGILVVDNIDGTIENPENGPKMIIAKGTVDTSVAGTYTITYKAKDAAGNIATKTRTVIVE